MVNGRWVFGGLNGDPIVRFSVWLNTGGRTNSWQLSRLSFCQELQLFQIAGSYDCLEDEGYKHLKVNHSLQFISPERGAHTNSIDATWSAIKRHQNHCQGQFDSYLAEYMWWRRKGSFRDFLSAITIYPVRMRRAGVGFTVMPSRRDTRTALGAGVSTAATFVEPQFISVYAYGCKGSDVNINLRRSDGPEARDSSVEDEENMSQEIEQVFLRGVRSLLTRYLEHRLEPALRDILMMNLEFL